MAKRKKIDIFSEPEIIDALIKKRIRSRKAPGHKPKWTEDELEIRDGVIWEYIGRQGLSREETAKQLMSRWDIAIGTARRYVKAAIERLADNYRDEEKEIRSILNERLETLLQESIEMGDRTSAISAIKTMIGLYGLNTEKKEITLKDTNLTFDFE